jgi:hypothetical protein
VKITAMEPVAKMEKLSFFSIIQPEGCRQVLGFSQYKFEGLSYFSITSAIVGLEEISNYSSTNNIQFHVGPSLTTTQTRKMKNT